MIEKPCGLCRGGTVEYAADCGHFFHFKCLEDMKFMQWECIICKLEREDKIAKEVLALYAKNPFRVALSENLTFSLDMLSKSPKFLLKRFLSF